MSHGRHVKVVGSADPNRLGSEVNVKAFLYDLVETLGMRPLGALSFDVPLAIEKMHAEPFEDEGGVTGVIVLSTSHAAIHTWPLRNWFVFDCYSCRDFESSAVLDKVTEYFGVGTVRLTDLTDALSLEG